MEEYLLERTRIEFNELNNIYSNLFGKWSDTWNNPNDHNLLYSCYVRLKIVAVLLRSCIQYDLIKNITLKTKDTQTTVSLKVFCDYCIHHSYCHYEDNGNFEKEHEIYLIITTDIKDSIAFTINENMRQINQIINNWP